MADLYSVPDAMERLARELDESAAALEAAGDKTWPPRLRQERAGLARPETLDLDLLMQTIDDAQKLMSAIGLNSQGYKLAWSILDVLVIKKGLET